MASGTRSHIKTTDTIAIPAYRKNVAERPMDDSGVR